MTIQANAVPSEFRLAAGATVELLAAADDAKALKKFNVVAYTGGLMNLRGFYEPVVVDLAGVQVPTQLRPVLRDHNPTAIVGHTTTIKVTASAIAVAGEVSGVGRDAREVIDAAANGFPWQASIGAAVGQMVEVAGGETVTVNGRTFNGPVLVARATTLREVSFVALGADDNTSAKVAANAAQPLTLEVISMNFEKWLQAKGHKLADLDDAKKVELKAAYDAEQKAAKPPADPSDPAPQPTPVIQAAGNAADAAVAEMRTKTAAEAKRISAIRGVSADHPDIQANAIEKGWTVEKAELEVLRASRAPAPAIHDGKEVPLADLRTTIECGIRLGSSEPASLVEKDYKPETLEAAEKYRGIGIKELVGLCCAIDGKPRSAHSFIQASAMDIAAAGFSTASLSGILGNTLRKSMLSAYNAVPSAARVVAKKLTVADFKTYTGYRLTGDFVMKKVGPDGELKHATIGEDSFTYAADTYGRIFGLTRQMIKNDDLNAFQEIPRMLGRGAALALESAFWTLVLANTGTFFGTGNLNYISGATTTLTSVGLAQATPKLSQQTDSDGNPILLTGKYLVVPPELTVAAQELFVSTKLQSGNTGKQPDANVFAGKYEPVESPYLSNSNYTGYSTTAWYLWGDPADIAAFGIAYVDGREVPVIEDAPLPSDILGKAWRGYLDFGVCQVDHRGAVKSKGAA